MLSKAAQTGRYGKKALRRVDEPESDLQAFTNEYIETRRIKHLRIPDTMNAQHLRHALAGIPDNLLLLPVTEEYSLVCALELKTRSKLRQSQKNFARDIPVIVAQTAEEVESAVSRAVDFAEKLRKRLSEPS